MGHGSAAERKLIAETFNTIDQYVKAEDRGIYVSWERYQAVMTTMSSDKVLFQTDWRRNSDHRARLNKFITSMRSHNLKLSLHGAAPAIIAARKVVVAEFETIFRGLEVLSSTHAEDGEDNYSAASRSPSDFDKRRHARGEVALVPPTSSCCCCPWFAFWRTSAISLDSRSTEYQELMAFP